MGLYCALAGCFVLIAALSIKIFLLRKGAEEIGEDLRERLETETNTPITVSTGDRKLRRLAATINSELDKLRNERRRFQRGDAELKNAVTNISHDLRTPLTAIYGYLDLLENEPQTETAARYLAVIRGRAEALSRLTEELFRYSILLTEELPQAEEALSVGAVLEESIAALYAAFQERGVEPRVAFPKEPVMRRVDRAALARVFSNLLSNALKYSDGDLEIRLTENGELTFSNRAAGLDEVQVGRLFDRFYTVEAARRSTGLGLSIARTLVERMGGTISADYHSPLLTIRVCLPQD